MKLKKADRARSAAEFAAIHAENSRLAVAALRRFVAHIAKCNSNVDAHQNIAKELLRDTTPMKLRGADRSRR